MAGLEEASTAPPTDGAKPCRSCGAQMVFVETIFGKRIPLDAEPNMEKGNIVVANGVAIYISGPKREGEARVVAERVGLRLYTSHFATCPNADQHRKASS